jgi:hypothetical protein
MVTWSSATYSVSTKGPVPSVPRASSDGSARPLGQTIGIRPAPSSRNPYGWLSVMVTVRAASSASTVKSVLGRFVPMKVDPLLGSLTHSKVSATAEAVSSWPSLQVMPSFSVKVTCFGVACQDAASLDTTSPSPST